MTDRAKGIVITLKNNVRVDDIQPLIEAFKFFNGVAAVEIITADVHDMIIESRYKDILREKLYKLIEEL